MVSKDQNECTERFVALLTEHREEVFSYVLSILPKYDEAEDVFQAVSILMWRKFDAFRPGTSFLRWALRIAQLEVCNYWRKKGHEKLSFWTDDLMEVVAETHVDHTELLQQQREALQECIGKLSESDRQLVLLKYSSSHPTTKAVALKLRRPPGTVYKALKRIRAALYMCVTRAAKRLEYGI